MWKKVYSTVTKEATKEQMWKLWSDPNSWHLHDKGIEWAKLQGRFEKGNGITLKAKGGPEVKMDLAEVIEKKTYTDVTHFFLAEMWDEHTLEETPNGLKITNKLWVTGLLSFLWIKLVAGNIAKTMPTDFEDQIKRAKTL
jgi:hypothetical protein